MTDTEIKAAIVTYGTILDRTEAGLKEIDRHMESLGAMYADLVKIHEDAARNIAALASRMEDKMKAEAVLRIAALASAKDKPRT